MAKQQINAYQNGGWYQELARVSVTTTTQSIVSPTFPAYKYLRIIVVASNAGGGTFAMSTRFNGDTGTNYAIRFSQNGAADATQVSQTQLAGGSSGTATGASGLHIMECYNILALNKNVMYWETLETTLGAATPPDKYEIQGKWANTTSQITQVTIINNGSGTGYAAGSELIILGRN